MADFFALLQDYTIVLVALGAAFMGVMGGAVGSFAVLRRQSLLGDALSHAALPGICGMFLLLGTKNLWLLLLGALISGLATVWSLHALTRASGMKTDSALSFVLAFFFGAGLLLLSYIQRLPGGNRAGLSGFIFGQTATLLALDVWVLGGAALLVLLLIAFFFKDFSLLALDEQYAKSLLGKRADYAKILLSALITAAIVLGLQAVGVILVSSLMVLPAVAARQWARRLPVMVVLSALLGGLSGFFGTLLSAKQGVATGPAVVLFLGFTVALSLLFAPGRGLLARALRHNRLRRAIKKGAGAPGQGGT